MKASERAEHLLIERIIAGVYPPDSTLPGERDLAAQLDVARPALREALQRMARDGWLTIQHGKPTRINDYMREGNLAILVSLIHADQPDFIPNLLEMWRLLAVHYTVQAVRRDRDAVTTLLHELAATPDDPAALADAQWRLHRELIALGGNPIYGLVLNSFATFYHKLAVSFFADASMRRQVRTFWQELAASLPEPDAAADVMRRYMTRLHTHFS